MVVIKRKVLLLLVMLSICITVAVQYLQKPLIVWNTTNSLPKGIYHITPGYQKGDIVAFDIPQNILPLMRERAWLPDYDRLLKRVVAVTGDTICFEGNGIYINGSYFDDRSPTDSQQRPMPQLSGCQTLQDEQVWVMLKDNPLSLDSRYFGAVDTHTIYGKAVPVFTY